MYKGYQDISGKFFSSIKYSAKKRKIDFNVTIEYIWDLYVEQDKKCKLSGVPIYLYRDKRKNTASLDRIDSTKGYEIGNVQWLDKIVNNLKGRMTQSECIEFCKNILFTDLHRKRPSWEEYFMLMADLVSTRSRDPNTHHGCVIVDENKKTISTGYNSPIQNIDDTQVCHTRPGKYLEYLHSEINAIIFAKRDLSGCYIFVTGLPCADCCKALLQAGISKIYYGNRGFQNLGSHEEVVRKMCKLKNVPLINISV